MGKKLQRTGKVLNHTFLFAGSLRFMKNALSLNIFKTMMEQKKSKYYMEEQKNFDYWKNKLNYTPELLESNYKGNSLMSYLHLIFMSMCMYSIFLTDMPIVGISLFMMFFVLWHRSLYYAKCIKDFSMYNSFFCVFKKLDDVFPNPFEPIKEKFSLIYDQEVKYLKK